MSLIIRTASIVFQISYYLSLYIYTECVMGKTVFYLQTETIVCTEI